jgi:flagellar motor protein MotB
MAERLRDRRNAGLRVRLVGYADRRGGVEENSELAAERAQKVALALEKMGIELERILIDGRPVRLTKPRIGERRVDIYLEKRAFPSSAALYPILVAFFFVIVFVVAAIIFRSRR